MAEIKTFLTNLGAKRLVALFLSTVVLNWLAFYRRAMEFLVAMGIPEDGIDRAEIAVGLINLGTLTFGAGIFLAAGIATFFVQVANTKPLNRTVALVIWAIVVVALILATKPDA